MKSLQTGSEDGGSNFWMIFFTKAGRFQHQMDLMELAGWLQVVFLLVFFPHETSIKRIQFFSHWNTIIQTVFPHETRIMSGFWVLGVPAKRLKHGAHSEWENNRNQLWMRKYTKVSQEGTAKNWAMKTGACGCLGYFLDAQWGVVIPLCVPNIPQSSQTESLGFPSYPLPLNTPPLKNPTRV